MSLSPEKIKQIEDDAVKFGFEINTDSFDYKSGCSFGYASGATAEAIKAAIIDADHEKIEDIMQAMYNDCVTRIKELEDGLREWESWEADLISNNAMWWPYAAKDSIYGKAYDKMIELQKMRNKLLTK